MEFPCFCAVLLLGFLVTSESSDMPSSGLSPSDGLLRLGSKTNYRPVFKDNFPQGYPPTRRPAPWSKICKPIHLELFARHGHRELGQSNLENAQSFAASFRGKYSQTTGANWFQNYTLPWKITNDMLLTNLGREVMKEYGKRVAKTWPELSFIGNNTFFFSSAKQRTYQSAVSFIDAFSAELGKDASTFKLNVDNVKTRYYDHCDKHMEAVAQNASAIAEAKKFLLGTEIGKVVTNLKERLGLEAYNDTMIDQDRGVLVDLYYMCQAELAENITRPIWCFIFNDTDAKAMEYYLDLVTYDQFSYGHEINSKMACPLVKYILSKMEEAVQGVSRHKEYDHGVFGFGHTGSLIPLISALGMYKPSTKLTASSFAEQAHRNFRMSRGAPLNGNVEIVLFDCDVTESSLKKLTEIEKTALPQNLERFMLELYSNEKRIKFPRFDVEFCPYTKFRESMRDFISCSFEETCRVCSASSSNNRPSVLVPLMLLIVMIQLCKVEI